jgi:hypothetical protein
VDGFGPVASPTDANGIDRTCLDVYPQLLGKCVYASSQTGEVFGVRQYGAFAVRQLEGCGILQYWSGPGAAHGSCLTGGTHPDRPGRPGPAPEDTGRGGFWKAWKGRLARAEVPGGPDRALGE